MITDYKAIAAKRWPGAEQAPGNGPYAVTASFHGRRVVTLWPTADAALDIKLELDRAAATAPGFTATHRVHLLQPATESEAPA